MNSNNNKVLVTGSSGFVGQPLTKALEQLGFVVYKLVRRESRAPDEISITKVNSADFENFRTVIHLAGDNIASGRWTKKKKQQIRDSRVRFTERLAEVLMELKNPPEQFISASAVGYYGDRGAEQLREDSKPGQGFLAEVCKDWEAASSVLATKNVKVAHLRIGMVLDQDGGALQKLLPIFSWGLGGRIGNGKQFMSWIALADLISAIVFIMEKQLSGPFNLTSPQPITNSEFTKALANTLGKPAMLPLPAFAAKLFLGQFAEEVLLSSVRAIPGSLQQLGFMFKFDEIEACLKDCIVKIDG